MKPLILMVDKMSLVTDVLADVFRHQFEKRIDFRSVGYDFFLEQLADEEKNRVVGAVVFADRCNWWEKDVADQLRLGLDAIKPNLPTLVLADCIMKHKPEIAWPACLSINDDDRPLQIDREYVKNCPLPNTMDYFTMLTTFIPIAFPALFQTAT